MATRPPSSNCASLSGLDARDLDDIVVATAHLVDDLRGASILVTGATGWFGTWLLDGLIALGRAASLDLRIIALSRRPERFAIAHPALHAAPEIVWVTGDVLDPGLAIDAPVTHVIHAATDADAAAASHPERLFETIVSGTRHVLALARRCRARRFLFVGSGAVYGPQAAGIERLLERSFDPSSSLSDAYARGKRAAEREATRDGTADQPIVSVARCFSFVGPHMPFDAHFAIGNFVRDAVVGVPIRVAGSGASRRSYLYMSDLVSWLLVILVRGAPGRAYNVGGAEAITIRELADRCAVLGATSVTIGGQPGGRDYVPDIGRATSELGLRVRVPLEEAIARTVRWRASQPASHEALVESAGP